MLYGGDKTIAPNMPHPLSSLVEKTTEKGNKPMNPDSKCRNCNVRLHFYEDIEGKLYKLCPKCGVADLTERISQALQQERSTLKEKVKKMTVTYIYDADYNHAFVLKKDVIGLIDQPKEE